MRETRPAATSVTVRAPAKVNLYLGVGAPRSDGFHPLATVYQAVGLYDDVTVADAPEWTVGLVEADDDVPLGEDNIAIKAGRALVAHHGLDRAARITIAKGIPVAGGMAGGSADAAATLIALDRLWDLRTSDEDLLALAAALGSDVPFSLVGGTATGVGRGEVVSAVPDLTSVWWVVVLAAEGLSTPAVYRHFDDLSPDAETEPELPARLLAALASGSYDDVALGLGNDLWDAARELRPELAAIEADLAGVGADAILLSGSGPTMLMLYGEVGAARSAAAEVAALGYRCVLAPGPVAGAHVVTYG